MREIDDMISDHPKSEQQGSQKVTHTSKLDFHSGALKKNETDRREREPRKILTITQQLETNEQNQGSSQGHTEIKVHHFSKEALTISSGYRRKISDGKHFLCKP